MIQGTRIDECLVTWGDRLFYPSNRIVRADPAPKLSGDALHRQAAAVRARIEATVRGRARQTVVSVTGCGHSMRSISAQFRYISRDGQQEIEDDRGETFRGLQAVRDLAEDWRYSGRLIPSVAGAGTRRQALYMVLSMPKGTDAHAVQRAAREFARIELAGHKYVMVLHDHQTNPHVHLSVKVESRIGVQLIPRIRDLYRWRETFSEQLRELGVAADASPQVTRGGHSRPDAIWKLKARAAGKLRVDRPRTQDSPPAQALRIATIDAWMQIGQAMAQSDAPEDRRLAREIARFVQDMPVVKEWTAPTPDRDRQVRLQRDRVLER